MRFGRNKKVAVLILLVAFALSLFLSFAGLAQQKPKAVNLSKGRTLGIGAPLPIPLGAYLVYWFNDSWGITGSGALYGTFYSLSGSLMYKFADNPKLDYLLSGSFSYSQGGWFGVPLVSYMSVGAGVGLEYSFTKSIAITGSATVSVGFGPTVYFTPGIGGGVVYYFM